MNPTSSDEEESTLEYRRSTIQVNLDHEYTRRATNPQVPEQEIILIDLSASPDHSSTTITIDNDGRASSASTTSTIDISEVGPHLASIDSDRKMGSGSGGKSVQDEAAASGPSKVNWDTVSPLSPIKTSSSNERASSIGTSSRVSGGRVVSGSRASSSKRGLPSASQVDLGTTIDIEATSSRREGLIHDNCPGSNEFPVYTIADSPPRKVMRMDSGNGGETVGPSRDVASSSSDTHTNGRSRPSATITSSSRITSPLSPARNVSAAHGGRIHETVSRVHSFQSRTFAAASVASAASAAAASAASAASAAAAAASAAAAVAARRSTPHDDLYQYDPGHDALDLPTPPWARVFRQSRIGQPTREGGISRGRGLGRGRGGRNNGGGCRSEANLGHGRGGNDDGSGGSGAGVSGRSQQGSTTYSRIQGGNTGSSQTGQGQRRAPIHPGPPEESVHSSGINEEPNELFNILLCFGYQQ